ncbi:uncharacterized protein LOC132455193 isoform X1 [Gadus macrocephalus]|uniref:uncharacterized protein LOC132455193 isoform X1 n=2 Tax=Gadus macrocephalus TaxID=80720 RepID=UPI0028CBBFED|nr:uncharacterized protein LOC132455193 isoform X1 [Gadus macrocephalus]
MHRSGLSSHVVSCGFDCHTHSYFYIQLLLSRDVACHTDYLVTNNVATRLSLKTLLPHFTSEEFEEHSPQRSGTSESLGVDAPGSSHMSSHSRELRILSVYGKGEGPLAVDGHDTLFTASEVEALNSLSADHSVVKSLERGERLVCREELSVQQQTPDTISIKVEEDIGGGMPAVEDCDAFGDRSTQRGATSESLGVDGPGSSHMSSHSGELKILSVYGKGEGPLAVDGHDTLFTSSEVEDLNSLSADHSVAKRLARGERLVRHEQLSMQQQTPDTISIKVEEDIGEGLPAVEDCDAFGDRSTQRNANSKILGVDAPGSSHWSSRSEELMQTPDTISIKVEEDIGGVLPAVEDGINIRDCSTQRGATSESLRVDAPGSSHMSSHSGALKILSVYGKGEGPLAVDAHDTLFTASEVDSLSADHSEAKSLERGERLVHREELSVQQTPDTISIKVEEDTGGGLPAAEDWDAFGDRSNQRNATSKILGVDAPGFSHMSSRREELVQTPDTISIKVEEDIVGGMPTVEDGINIRDCSTQRGATSESLRVDAPGSSHMSSHSGALKILSVYGKGEGPLAVDAHDTLFTASEVEALSSLSADHSVAKSLNCSVRLVRLEELTGHQGGRKGRPGVLCGKVIPNNANMIVHMRTRPVEKRYGCEQCTKSFTYLFKLKNHMRTHTGEKPYSCDQCTKIFSQHYELKNHMRTHSREKPYSCDQCMKSFSQQYDLKNHMRTHTGERPYGCDQCIKRYSQKGKLSIHMRTHSGEKPYRCDQCAKRYSHSSTLKIHMRTHTGEKPHRCDQCTKCFSQSEHLKSHMKTHTGEKPYSCDHCTKRFARHCNLNVHMKTHTGEKFNF